MIRGVLELPDQLCELLWPAENDGLQVAPNLPRQREQHVWVFAQIARQPDDRRLRGRRHEASLNLAQIGRLDADALRHLADTEANVRLGACRARHADVVAEAGHVYCVRHSTRCCQGPKMVTAARAGLFAARAMPKR